MTRPVSKEKKIEEKYNLLENLAKMADETLPTEVTRRDTIVMFTGFDEEVNRKLLGAVYQFFKR